MATPATFSKTKACEAIGMHGGCDMVLPMADRGTISSDSLFISRDGCTVIAHCYYWVVISTQTLLYRTNETCHNNN